MRRAAGLLAMVFLLGQTAELLQAQTVTGSILGTVVDAAGARTAGAPVAAVNELTGERHVTATNSVGDYIFAALPIGKYRIEVEVQGFKKYVRQGIVLDVNENARADATLELGQVNERVVVTGDVSLVDTHEVQMGGLVDTYRINDLPLNGRDVYGLVTLLPGVAGLSVQDQPDVAQGNQMSVNGSRALQTSFLLDGNLNNSVFHNGGLQAPNPDAVEQFRLITSNYNAEYGRSAGGVVNVITRSGTNRYHGTLFEYLRNNDLDARSFFTPSVSALKQNQFGGTLGGPVKRDKLFFFFSYQGTRQRAGEFVNTARTPTATQRQGDFSALPANQRPRDPDTGQPFPNAQIPASRLDPVAKNLLAMIALPNTPDGRVQDSASASVDNDEYMAKGDYLLSSSHRITLSSFLVRTNDVYPFTNQNASTNIPNFMPVANRPSQNNVSASETWTITPTLLNQFQFSYTNGTSGTINLNTKGLPDLGSQITLGTQSHSPPKMQVTNGWSAAASGNLVELDQIYSWSDTLSWVRGGHSLKTGALFQHFMYDYNSGASAPGTLIVQGAFSGNSFSDFELGRTQFGAGVPFLSYLRSNNLGLFAQDDWKVSRRVTLNLGIRYEVFSPFTEIHNHLSNWIFGQQSRVFPNAPLGMVYPGDPGVPDGLVPTRYGNFAPRIGVAFDPFGDGKTAIRTGFGVFYSTGFAGLSNSNLGQPFQPSATIPETPSLVNPYANLATPFPPPPGVTSFTLPATVPWMNQDNVAPYVGQYNFTVQRQLQQNLSLSAAYVGNVSRHLQLQRDANSPVYIAGQSNAANMNQRRPIEPGIVAILTEAETAANASYNALQVTLDRRFAHGLTLLANYTFSKAIDIQSADQQTNTSITFVDSNHLNLDRAPSNFDRRQILNLSFLWSLPKTGRWGFVGKQILSGWQVNGIARYGSGGPINVTSGTDTNQDGNATDRPNLIGNPRLPSDRPKSQVLAAYINKAAFQAAALGSDGTAGRNILYGLGSANWNTSFFKAFTIRESHRVQFRAELFNAFNQASFGAPVAVLSNPNFGQILTAGAGRIVQFGLKYSF